MKNKKLYILCIAMLFASGSFAQITIDSTDMPSIGDTIIRANDSILPVGIAIGGTGLQSWNFTAMQVDYLDTLRYVDPAATPYSADFSSSNLAIEGIQPTVFQSLSSLLLSNDGYAGNDPFGAGVIIKAKNNPPQTLLEFPSTDGSFFSDTSGFEVIVSTAGMGLPVPNVDSIWLIHSSYAASTIDAYGTVDLPSGNFTTVRQLYTDNTIDSVYAYCSDPAGCNVFITILPFGWSFLPSQLTEMVMGLPNPNVDTTFTYRWFAKGEDIAVVTLRADVPGGTALSGNFKIGSAVVADITATVNVLCKNNCTGTATAMGISGVLPYSYLWDDSAAQTTATATGLCAATGTYSVIIIDGIGDTSMAASAVISEPAAVLMVSTTILSSDSGNADGSVSSTVTGGITPYTYVWSTTPSQTAASATNLIAGSYVVTVTDANGCISTDTGIVTLFVGIENYNASMEGLLIYPNPAAVEINLISTFNKEVVFKVYNVIGKQLIRRVLDDKVNMVPTAELADGMYIYQLEDKEGRVLQTGKFSVVK